MWKRTKASEGTLQQAPGGSAQISRGGNCSLARLPLISTRCKSRLRGALVSRTPRGCVGRAQHPPHGSSSPLGQGIKSGRCGGSCCPCGCPSQCCFPLPCSQKPLTQPHPWMVSWSPVAALSIARVPAARPAAGGGGWKMP